MRLRPRLAAAILLLAGSVLSACSTPPQRHAFADLTYGHLPPIRLDVAVVDVVNDYRPPMRWPNVEHLFPVQPATAAQQWAKDRLVAAGSSGSALFTVVDASAVEIPLERTTGIKGLFTEDQAERYTAVLEVRLDLRSGDGRTSGRVSARAERSQTVPEDATLNDREGLWYDLTEALMKDLNAELERNVHQHLGAFLR